MGFFLHPLDGSPHFNDPQIRRIFGFTSDAEGLDPQAEPVAGVIGLGLLRQFTPTIDYAQQTLELRRPGRSYPVGPDAQRVPFELWGESELTVYGSLNGAGFFQVQMPDGTNAYTRDGSFQLDAAGQIVTANNHKLMLDSTADPNRFTTSISEPRLTAYVATTHAKMPQNAVAIFENRRYTASGASGRTHRR